MHKADRLSRHSLGRWTGRRRFELGRFPQHLGSGDCEEREEAEGGDVHAVSRTLGAEASVAGGVCPPERAWPVPHLDSVLT